MVVDEIFLGGQIIVEPIVVDEKLWNAALAYTEPEPFPFPWWLVGLGAAAATIGGIIIAKKQPPD